MALVFHAAYEQTFVFSVTSTHLVLCCFLLQILFELFGIREFFPSNEVVRALASHLCNHHVARYLCENFVFLISGFDEHQTNVVSLFLWHRQISTCPSIFSGRRLSICYSVCLCPFTMLTLMVGQHEGNVTCKKSCSGTTTSRTSQTLNHPPYTAI